ncbi:MAG: binding-protein-dependent transport system inner rane component [Proteobacteria bacterium]|nr:binding-protein-dependent transport system inner rane component [Pseudomonadota bacterium]
MFETLRQALSLLAHLDNQVLAIVWLSFKVSLAAVTLAALLGLPLGALVAVASFPGRGALTVVLNGMMGLPSVVVGVVVYLFLSRSGPFGDLGLLYSAPAMIAAQTVLVTPLMAALTRQIVEDAWREYANEFNSMRFSLRHSVVELLYDCRFSLVVAVLAGMGRSLSEVGAVMIVGGNIEGFTRVMTTAIALETAKGDLPLSLALGVVLLTVVLLLNSGAYLMRQWAMRKFG